MLKLIDKHIFDMICLICNSWEMIIMYKAYKFRLYLDKAQNILVNKSFGCSRKVYNYYLSKIKNNGYINAYSNITDYVNYLKYKYSYLQEVDSTLIRKSLFNLDNSLKKYYNNGFGYPKYKSKYDKNSYCTNAIYNTYKDKKYCNIEIDLGNRLIKLPKLGWVKFRGYRNIDKIAGRIINATISRELNGKYYVSIVIELPKLENKAYFPRNIIGIDLGVKKLLTLSDGTSYDNNKYIEKYEKRIKRKQRELSRKQKSSNNYYKCKHELNVLYTKLKNSRKYYLHKITKTITDNNDVIICENLHTKEMLQEKIMSKRIADATFGEIIRQLEYKSKEKHKYIYQVDTYYPSSQICNNCGHRDIKYKNVNERIYECSVCSNKIDRDINASINIMWEGMKLYMKDNQELLITIPV